MKKTLLLILLLSCCFCAFSMSFTYRQEIEEYDSFPMLQKFYQEDETLQDEAYWNKCKVEIITVSRGKEIYSWFGHSAVLISVPGARPVMYDWGTFAFDDGFYLNFALGRLWYTCSASYGDSRIKRMELDKRTVSAVELDLTAAQKYAVVSFLETNSTPPNNVYLYKYFTDNCATRVRDLLSYITKGDFEKWARSQASGTIRQQTSRPVSTNPFIAWGFDFLESGIEDKKVTVWEDMFLPEKLEEALLSYGKLGKEQTYYTDFRTTNTKSMTPEDPQNVFGFCLVVSLVISCLALFSVKKNTVFSRISSFSIDLIFGILGLILFFMMTFTIHDAVFMNENILFLNPLLLVSAFFSLDDKKKKVRSNLFKVLTSCCLVLIVLKFVLPSVFLQENWTIILTMLPYYIINGFLSCRA